VVVMVMAAAAVSAAYHRHLISEPKNLSTSMPPDMLY